MRQRLQILVDTEQLRAIRRLARARHVTVSEWIRRALRAACDASLPAPSKRKLDIVRAAARYSFPTAEIGPMLAETDRGFDGYPGIERVST